MFFRNIMLLAAESAAGEVSDGSAVTNGGGAWLSSLSPLLMLAVFALVFYFVLIRPEKKRKKEAQSQRDAMKVGDTVITIGGITGEVERIMKDTITIYTGNCSMDIQKWAIRTVEADELTDDTDELPEETADELPKDEE